MHARWYAPYLNRWTQPDTLVPNPGRPQNLNRYTYVGGSPVCLSDPSGHCPICAVMLIAAGAAALAVEITQIGAHAEATGQTFWQAATDPALNLDQVAMVDAALKGAMVVPAVVGGAGLVGTGAGGLLQQTGMWSNNAQLFAAGTTVQSSVGETLAWTYGVSGARAPWSGQSATGYEPEAVGQAAQETVRLYRAVSEAEFQQITRSGQFEVVPQSSPGKYSATTVQDAGAFGQRMMGAGNYRIIQVDVGSTAVGQFYYWERIDSIGPAYLGTMDQLNGAYTNILEAR
jgi:hypothetical protein